MNLGLGMRDRVGRNIQPAELQAGHGLAQLEKQIADNKDKLASVDVASIESLIKEGRAAVEKQDDEQVQSVLERLEKEAHAMATKMYEGAGNPPGGGAPGAGPSAGGGAAPSDDKKKGDVIDAEFEETN